MLQVSDRNVGTARPSIAMVTSHPGGIRGLRTALKAVRLSRVPLRTVPPEALSNGFLEELSGLIILHDRLPECDALAMLERLKTSDTTKLVISEAEDRARVAELLTAGAYECLTRAQIKEGELPFALQRALERAAGRTRLDVHAPAADGSGPRLQTVFRHLPIPAYIWQVQGDDLVLVDYNSAGAAITEGKVAGWVGRKASELYAAQPELPEELKRCHTTQQVIESEMRYRMHVTDEVYDFEVQYIPVPPDLVVVLTKNVTAIHKAERLWEEATSRLEAEVAARTAELQFKAELLDLASDAILARDPEGTILFWNNAAEEMYGYSREEAVGRSVQDLLQTELPQPLGEVLDELLRTGEFEGEVTQTTRGGERLVMWSRWSLQRDESGKPVAILQTNRDITVRKRAEAALREQAELLNLAHDAIFTLDPDGTILYWNRGAELMYGWSADEAIGKMAADLLKTRFPVSFEKAKETVFHAGVFEGELEHTTRYGQKLVVASRWAAQYDEQGNAVAFLEINHDITARVLMEEALRASEDRFREAFAHAPVGMVLNNLDGRFLQVNAAYCRIVGYSEEELLNGDFDFMTLTHPDDRTHNTEEYRRLFAGEIPAFFMEKRYIRKDGETVWVRVSATLRRDEAGNPIQTVGIVEDITDRKRTEEALRESQERLSSTVAAVHLGLWDLDLSTQQISMEGSLYTHLGYAANELPTTLNGLHGLLHPDDLEATRKRAAEIQDSGRSTHESEVRMRAKNGEWRWILSRGQVTQRDKNGRALRVQGVHMDVTERKHAEEALAEWARQLDQANRDLEQANVQLGEEVQDRLRVEAALRRAMQDTERHRAQLEAVFETVEDGIVVCDMRGRFLLVNESEARINGYENAEAMKLDLAHFAAVYELRSPDGTVLPVEDWPASRVLRGESLSNWELRGRRKDTGREWYFSFSGEPVYNELGEQVLAVVVTRDITERKRSEEALRDAEQRYASLFANRINGIAHLSVITDEQGVPVDYRVLEVNEAYTRITGIAKDRIEGKTAREVFPGIEHFPFDYIGTYGRIALEGGEIQFEDYFAPLGIWISVYAYQPKPGECTAMFTDVTPQKRAEEALRESEARLRHMADSMPQLVWTAEPDGRVDYYNERHRQYSGIVRGEDGVYHWGPVLHEDDLAATAEAWRHAVATGEIYQIEHRVQMAEGGFRWHLSRGLPVRDELGAIVKWFGTATDIHDLKQTEAALQRSEARLRATFDQAGVGIVEVDSDRDRFIAVNDRICEMLEYSRDELLGMSVHDLTHADDRARSDDLNARLHLGEMDRFDYEKRYLKKGGAPLWAHVNVSAVRDSRGKWLRSIATIEDISERKAAEKAMREVADQRRLALEAASLGTWSFNLQSGVITGDERTRTLFASPVDTVPYEGFLQMVHPEDRPGLEEAIRQVIDPLSDGCFEQDYRIVHPDGSVHWVSVKGQVYFEDSGGERQGVLFAGTVMDITDRKRTEEILQRSEALLRQAGQMAHLGAWEIEFIHQENINANPLHWSDECFRIFGYEPGAVEVTNDLFFAHVHPEDRSKVVEAVAQAIAARRAYSVEHRLLRSVGAERIVTETADISFDESGRPLRMTGAVQDITDRRKGEEALRQSEERFRAVFEESPLGILISDEDEEILDINPALRGLLGYSAEEIRNMGLAGILHAEDLAVATKLYADLVQGRRNTFHLETRFLRRNGQVLQASLTVFGIRDAGDKLLYMTGMVEDITRRKEAEELIRRHSVELERLVAERTEQVQRLEQQRLESEKQVAVGRMAARIAHEINNPLAGVKNSFILIKRAIPPDHKHFDFVGRIDREIDRIARIVRQMFELYRPEQRDPSQVRVEHVIREVAELLEGNARAQGVTLEINTAGAARPVCLHEDSLRQVLFSLLQNAIEASPASSTVRVNAAVDGSHLALTVADEGEGIPEEVESRIFEPFFTTKSGLSTGGLGLGLSITRGLIQAMGGTVGFKSEVGKGTTFTIRLPLQ